MPGSRDPRRPVHVQAYVTLFGHCGFAGVDPIRTRTRSMLGEAAEPCLVAWLKAPWVQQFTFAISAQRLHKMLTSRPEHAFINQMKESITCRSVEFFRSQRSTRIP